jgi:NDP-sugar pyrophosphorylase family protein
VAALVDAGARLRAVPVAGAWWDIGTPDDLAAARAQFS